MYPTDTNTPLFATQLYEYTVAVYATHIAYRQYWSQEGSIPLAEIVSVEQSPEGLANVVVTTHAGKTVGFLVRRDDREALCTAFREAQSRAAGQSAPIPKRRTSV